MRKYDLILVIMYLFIIATSVINAKSETKLLNSLIAQSVALTENQEVERVIISNTTSNIDIYIMPEAVAQGTKWGIKGYIEQEYIENMTIEDGTLRIEGIEGDGLRGVLRFESSVNLEVVNSPNITWLTDDEFATKVVNNPQFDYLYEL